jgi:hypothetical protein
VLKVVEMDEMKEDNWEHELATYSDVCLGCGSDSRSVYELAACLEEKLDGSWESKQVAKLVDESDELTAALKDDNRGSELATYSVVCLACGWDSSLVVEMVA